MAHDPTNPNPARHISVRSLVGSILLIIALIAWFFLLWSIYGFSVAVGEFLRVVVSLSNSAG
jgi:hypothetical protein